MKRSGGADLTLHGGRVPQWLAERMTKLGAAVTETIIHDYWNRDKHDDKRQQAVPFPNSHLEEIINESCV